jgi:hypothetical protein
MPGANRLLTLLAAAVAGAAAAQPEAPAPIAVLMTGQFHGDEVPPVDGRDWLALIDDGRRARLEPVNVRSDLVHDALLDAEQGPFTGRQITHDAKEAPLAIVSGPMLRAGALRRARPVKTAQPWWASRYTFAGRAYALVLEDDCGDAGCRWTLSDGSVTQTLETLWVTRAEDGTPDSDSTNTGILWAGDLDGDDRLDLVVDVSNHYNAVMQVRVLLSSLAGPGELVGLAGGIGAVGC